MRFVRSSDRAKDRYRLASGWRIAILFTIVWAITWCSSDPGRRSPSLEGSGTGEPASYAWTFLDLEDRPATFERFKGKMVFLNIWATWCGPCVQEMPSIARLAEDPRLKDKGIAFVCVSIDESGETVRRFLEGHPWKMSFFRAETLPPVFLTEGSPRRSSSPPTGGSSPSRSAQPGGTARKRSRCSRNSPPTPRPLREEPRT